jgi:hypothetical protein
MVPAEGRRGVRRKEKRKRIYEWQDWGYDTGSGGSAETEATVTGGGATITGVGTAVPGPRATVAWCRGAELRGVRQNGLYEAVCQFSRRV